MPAGRCPVEFVDPGDILRRDDGELVEVSSVLTLRDYSDEWANVLRYVGSPALRVELTTLTERGEFVTEEFTAGHEVMVWQTATEALEAKAAAA